jgi:hypothetical protein
MDKKKDILDIFDLYSDKKLINRKKQKDYLKKHPELWLKKMYKQKAKKK